MERIDSAMKHLEQHISADNSQDAISFQDFSRRLKSKPDKVIRNVFQLFHDMIRYYVGEGTEEYPDDPESIKFMVYNFIFNNLG